MLSIGRLICRSRSGCLGGKRSLKTAAIVTAIAAVFRSASAIFQTLDQMILDEIEDERRWDEAFSRSPDILAKLAASAMAEYRSGKTQELIER